MRTTTAVRLMVWAMLASLCFLKHVLAADLPAPNLALWLRADAGVTADASGSVSAWADQAGGLKNDSIGVAGTPKLVETTFPAGIRQVIRLDGQSGINLANPDELRLPDLSIYVVATLNASRQGEQFISNYRNVVGWAVGISDSIADRVKWFTAGGSSLEPDGAQLELQTPYLVTATWTTSTGDKTLYLNSIEVGAESGLSISYGTGTTLSVGYGAAHNFQYFTGDIAEILVYSSVSEDQRAAVESYLNKKYFTPPSGPPVVIRQPESQQVAELQPATFKVVIDGLLPMNLQWLKNGTPIPGATNLAYTLASATRQDQNAQFSVHVSNSLGSTTSSNATLTVDVDNTPPTLISARRGITDATVLVVVFSESVSASTATRIANYAINNGITISKAEAGATPNLVLLTTSPITPGAAYTLTVNGVQDLVGNAIAANTQALIGIASLTIQPPTSDLKLWLKADAGVTNSGTEVAGWADQAGGVPNNGIPANGVTGEGSAPQLLTAVNFPTGPRPVIHLDGTTGFVLENVHDLDMPSVTVYVVASVDNTTLSGTFIANLRDGFGFSMRLSDATAGRASWFTGEPGDSMEPTAASLPNQTPALLTGAFAGGVKKFFVNGLEAASSTSASLANATENALTVGCQGVYPVGYEESGAPPRLSRFLTGDLAEILVYSSVSEAQRLAVEAYLYEKYISQPAGAPVIATQPQNQHVIELQPVTMAVKVNGTPPLSLQWFKNGTAIPGATSIVHAITVARRNDAGQYSVRITNSLGSVISTNALLTVDADTVAPALVSADRDFLDYSKVNVIFSEPVSAASATSTANYTINNNITILRAEFGATDRTVVLTTSPIDFGPVYTLTVNGVQDWVGNLIAPNSQRRMIVPDPNAPVPTTDLKLWIRADMGVSADADGIVTYWADQGGGVLNDSETIVGTPLAWEGTFPSGPHPVIYFDGSSGIRLANPSDLQIPEMSLYVVASTEAINSSRIFIDLYRDVVGYGLGISDSIPGRVKWFTAPPNSMEPAAAQLEEYVPVLITGTYKANGEKKLYMGTNQVGSATGVNLAYGSGMELTVGYLQGNRQYLIGTVAEILVYSAVSDSQREVVQNYLINKYLVAGAGTAVIIRQPQSQQVAELQSVTFEVAFQGQPPFTFQWFRNGEAIPDATRPALNLPRVTRRDQNAQFSVQVSNDLGSIMSSNALLTVELDTVLPTLLSAQRDLLDAAQVWVVFSKPVSEETATNAANYTINNGVTVHNAAAGGNANTFVLTTSPITPGPAFALTVNRVQDLVGNTIAANTQTTLQMPLPPRLQDAGPDGLLAIEAERYDRNLPAGGTTWTLTTENPGFSGEGAMQPMPNAGRNVNIDVSASPRLDFVVNFVQSGTHYLWVRGLADSAPGPSANDSVNIGLDNELPSNSDRIDTFPQGAGYVWTQHTADSLAATFDVLSTGSHLVTIWMREDGFIADKLLITSNPNYTPSGIGPADSRPGPEPPRLDVAWAGLNLVISWTGGGTLQTANQVNGPWSDVAGATTSPVTIIPSETSRFYRLRQ